MARIVTRDAISSLQPSTALYLRGAIEDDRVLGATVNDVARSLRAIGRPWLAQQIEEELAEAQVDAICAANPYA
jgi:hypothetical protein